MRLCAVDEYILVKLAYVLVLKQGEMARFCRSTIFEYWSARSESSRGLVKNEFTETIVPDSRMFCSFRQTNMAIWIVLRDSSPTNS
jgi:dimeric dUTPase (all-alpha-NTP-PPase superfamily)